MARKVDALVRKSRKHRVYQETDDPNVFEVISGTSKNEYKVRLYRDGGTCTCEWGRWSYVRSGGDRRSACTHVIAAYFRKAKWMGVKVEAHASSSDASKVGHRLYVGDGIWLASTRKAIKKLPGNKRAKVAS